MRRTIAPAIPPKMYRHFAVVTVLLTAGLALFADGENREAVAGHIEQRQQEAEVREASYAKFGAPRLGGSAARRAERYDFDEGSDFDKDFGNAMERPSGGRRSGITEDEQMALAAGYSSEYLSKLTPAELERLMAALRQNVMAQAAAAAAAQAAAAPRPNASPTGTRG